MSNNKNDIRLILFYVAVVALVMTVFALSPYILKLFKK